MFFQKWSKLLIGVLIFVPLSGCATTFHDLTISEFRRAQNLHYKTVNLNKSLKTLSDILVAYNNNCNLGRLINMNPDQLSGSIVWQVPRFTDAATMGVMDFKEVNKNNTEIKVWADLSCRRHIDNILRILENPGTCP